MPEHVADVVEKIIPSEEVLLCTQQIVEIITGSASLDEESRRELVARHLDSFEKGDNDFDIDVAEQVAGHRLADVRRYAIELLRPYSGRVERADALLWGKLLQDRASTVLVPAYEMLRQHSQNATFEALHRKIRRPFPGLLLVDRMVLMSAATPRYEHATRNRK